VGRPRHRRSSVVGKSDECAIWGSGVVGRLALSPDIEWGNEQQPQPDGGRRRDSFY
jgi:hypothetical protein